jgi:hypothetical protein
MPSTRRGQIRIFTTVASTHAYSNLHDYIAQAKLKGIKLFAITDHGPDLRLGDIIMEVAIRVGAGDGVHMQVNGIHLSLLCVLGNPVTGQVDRQRGY